ncbi:GntR family transcriptional regulator [Micrococcales bacterium 31B]|nr:GntR family transcriptional regulator [Micrococcales bacterium 31B]
MLDIAPGDPLHDGQIAAEMGVGRTPVREAIKRLEGDRLVISYPRRGTFAAGVDIAQLADVSEIRELLEPLAARRAARLASPSLRASLREVSDAISLLGTGGGAGESGAGESGAGESGAGPSELMRYDIQVHRLIYKAAANPHLEDVLIRYDNLATRIWCYLLDKMPSVRGHISEHVDLLAAIIDGDEERAAALALHHVTSFEETVRTVL